MLRIIVLIMAASILSGCLGEDAEAPEKSEEAEETEETTAPEASENEEGSAETVEPEAESSGTTEETATVFDINDAETQEILLSSDHSEDTLTFDQDVITEGMTQAEVEDAYGGYDFIYPGHGRWVTIYDNLGVVYSLPGPYGEEELATTEVDPDEVTVENVMYYAGETYDEVVDALGAPDMDVYTPEEGPADGYQFMEYIIEDYGDTELVGTFRVHEDENGDLMVDVMTKDERPKDADAIAGEPENETGSSIDDEFQGMLTSFIESYLSALEDYYNDDSEEVFDYTEPSSENGSIIMANKESGNFREHENHDVEILEMEEREALYYVTAAREYSHATSGGRYITTVEYEIINTPQGFKVGSFEELDNEPAGDN